MRWIRYETGGGVHYGIMEGDQIAEADSGPFESFARTGRRFDLTDVRILPPLMPLNFYAVGYNYLGHTNEASEFLQRQQRAPTKPDVGYRAASALIAHGENIEIPAGSSGLIQYEGELVAVIGRKAKRLSESEALSCVFGYTIGNDVSERTWQRADRTMWRAKNSDTFKPMGPWIETEVDLASLTTRVRLNGRQVSEFKTNNMIFGVARYISEISQYITLHPGDVLWMGTEAPTLDIKAGDVVEIEIDGIGVLRNPVVAE
jgi:2-keto-4-pentenoate hydratase/2-oxohepta-3-ene-1,7-dioic acid hydratase in catechol pathway